MIVNIILGETLSVVLACEVIKHPDVKFPSKDIPSNYIVVPNNDHLRPVYLFIYSSPSIKGMTF